MTTADGMHEVLLGLAGRVPDDFLASARRQLADGAVGDVAVAVTHELARSRVPVSVADAAVLSELVDESAFGAFTGIPLSDVRPPLVWLFAGAGEQDVRDETTAALVEVLAATPSARGLWMAWRTPLRDDGPRVPVYVVTTDGGDLAALAGRLCRVLDGRADVPRVEVVGPGDAPSYQRAARAGGRLVWAAAEPVEMFVVRVFDGVDAEGGPVFDEDHPRIADPAERERVLAYLGGGELLLGSGDTMADVVAPERGRVVPMNYRTDGVWLWPDAVSYYLEHHDLAPDAPFLAHIYLTDQPPARLDAVTVHRALSHLLGPVD
ncbi:hypothetical protein ACQPZF_25915 [Actinosynnema sp. CS-041913]|uniref:hypothetical protein n=1 Tax=Actinosynnema sp. CS-041913 TaxID=3239917 RepID=UPI003D920A1E